MNTFASLEDRNKRNLRLPTFVKHLGLIHTFVCRGDSFDGLRGLACGIEFGSNSFLINTCLLKKLMTRSKSSMNGCFQKLGYAVCRPSSDISTLFEQILPGWGSHLFIAKQWSVRKAIDSHSVSFTPNVRCEIAFEDDRTIAKTPNVAILFDIKNLLNHQVPDSIAEAMVAE
jgi:hypothetical protein